MHLPILVLKLLDLTPIARSLLISSTVSQGPTCGRGGSAKNAIEIVFLRFSSFSVPHLLTIKQFKLVGLAAALHKFGLRGKAILIVARTGSIAVEDFIGGVSSRCSRAGATILSLRTPTMNFMLRVYYYD